jgi:hypothetical protein
VVGPPKTPDAHLWVLALGVPATILTCRSITGRSGASGHPAGGESD